MPMTTETLLFNIDLQLASLYFERKLLPRGGESRADQLPLLRTPIQEPKAVVFENVRAVDGRLPDLTTRLSTSDGTTFTITLRASAAPQSHRFVRECVERWEAGTSAAAVATVQSVEKIGFFALYDVNTITTLHGSATVVVRPEPPARRK